MGAHQDRVERKPFAPAIGSILIEAGFESPLPPEKKRFARRLKRGTPKTADSADTGGFSPAFKEVLIAAGKNPHDPDFFKALHDKLGVMALLVIIANEQNIDQSEYIAIFEKGISSELQLNAAGYADKIQAAYAALIGKEKCRVL